MLGDESDGVEAAVDGWHEFGLHQRGFRPA
jgi:hypothetical protein